MATEFTIQFKSLKYSESASPKDHFCEVSLKSVGSGELINTEMSHQVRGSSDVTHSKSGRHTIDSQTPKQRKEEPHINR